MKLPQGNNRLISKMHALLTILLLLTLATRAQSTVEKIDELMQAYYNTGKYTGVVLVADSGKVIYRKAFGYANYGDSIPNTLEGKFRISSMTKQFTAMLIMQLVQEGKLELSGKITDYLPYYRKETGDQVTIHHLLCHQSGIPSISRNKNFRNDSIRNPFSPQFLVKHWCMDDLQFEPGTSSKYSNSNYNILGAIIEEVTGKPYEKVLKEKILEPAGMKNSGLVPDSSAVNGMPSGYLYVDSTFKLESKVAYSNFHAAGQMYATLHDMYLWDRALAGNTLLDKKWQQKIFTPNHNGHGYGWKVYRRLYDGQKDSCTTSYHAGGFGGFHSFIQRFHERNMVMIFLDNTSLGRRKTGMISDDIINILFGLPYEIPVRKKPIPLTLEAFRKFTGSYSGVDGIKRLISLEDNRMIYTNDRGRKYLLHPEAPLTFFFDKEHRWTIDFSANGNTMTIRTPPKNTTYKKE